MWCAVWGVGVTQKVWFMHQHQRDGWHPGEAGGIGAGLHERVEKNRTGNGPRCVLQHSGVCAELCAGLRSIDLTCLLTYVGRGQAASALTGWHVDVRHSLHRRHYLSAPTFLCNRAWPCWSVWRMMKHHLLCSLPGGVACVSACLWTELHEVPQMLHC